MPGLWQQIGDFFNELLGRESSEQRRQREQQEWQEKIKRKVRELDAEQHARYQVAYEARRNKWNALSEREKTIIMSNPPYSYLTNQPFDTRYTIYEEYYLE